MIMGELYILCLHIPYKGVKHYIGWTRNIQRRYYQHCHSKKHLIGAINAAGIEFNIYSLGPGTRADERKLKRQHNHKRQCPMCSPKKLEPIPF